MKCLIGTRRHPMLTKFIVAFGFRTVLATGGAILLVFSITVATLVGTGQTFGQRCKAAGVQPDSAQWGECVRRLARDGQATTDVDALAVDGRPGEGALAAGR